MNGLLVFNACEPHRCHVVERGSLKHSRCPGPADRVANAIIFNLSSIWCPCRVFQEAGWTLIDPGNLKGNTGWMPAEWGLLLMESAAKRLGSRAPQEDHMAALALQLGQTTSRSLFAVL